MSGIEQRYQRIGLRILLGSALLLLAGSCVERPAPPVPIPQALPPAPGAVEVPAPSEELVLRGVPVQGHVLFGRAAGGTRSMMLNGADVPLTADRRFLIAFDRDAEPLAILRLTLSDGRVIERQIRVRPGDWRIEKVNASLTAGMPSAEFKRRRAGELALIGGARAAMLPDSSEGWRQSFVWPVVARISGNFGAQRIYRGTPGSYHTGVDIAARAGTVFVAPADGVVMLAADAPFTLEGNLLLIDHGMGLNSAFLHSQRLLVRVGEVVRRGQPIGVVGATGRVSGPHLHWGMKWNDARIDPVAVVEGGGEGSP